MVIKIQILSSNGLEKELKQEVMANEISNAIRLMPKYFIQPYFMPR